MIQQTINGRDVIINYDESKRKYIVWCEGETIEMEEKPVTDQDVKKFKREMDNITRHKLVLLGANLLRESISSLLNNDRY